MQLKDLPIKIIGLLGPLEHFLAEERLIIPTDKTDDLRRIAKEILFQKVQPYYRRCGLDANLGIFNFLVEPLKNANYHGNSTPSNPIRLGIFLTPQALVASYNDGGLYFKRQDVKEAYENKIPHPEKHHLEQKDVGFGFGTEIIYDLSDLLYVETTSGTLFTVLSTSNSMFFRNL
jgi:hypothetical protein